MSDVHGISSPELGTTHEVRGDSPLIRENSDLDPDYVARLTALGTPETAVAGALPQGVSDVHVLDRGPRATLPRLASDVHALDQRLVARIQQDPERVAWEVAENRARILGLEARIAALEADSCDSMVQLLDRILRLEARLPEGQANSSAPLLRDMNEADALICIRDARPHQEVADELGLTYGQVYSCRLEYTFKKVHARLRREGWKPIWHRTVHGVRRS